MHAVFIDVFSLVAGITFKRSLKVTGIGSV